MNCWIFEIKIHKRYYVGVFSAHKQVTGVRAGVRYFMHFCEEHYWSVSSPYEKITSEVQIKNTNDLFEKKRKKRRLKKKKKKNLKKPQINFMST